MTHHGLGTGRISKRTRSALRFWSALASTLATPTLATAAATELELWLAVPTAGRPAVRLGHSAAAERRTETGTHRLKKCLPAHSDRHAAETRPLLVGRLVVNLGERHARPDAVETASLNPAILNLGDSRK